MIIIFILARQYLLCLSSGIVVHCCIHVHIYATVVGWQMLSRRLQCLDLYTYSLPATSTYIAKGSNTTAITVYALCQLPVHYKENTTTNTISIIKRDRKTSQSIQIRLKYNTTAVIWRLQSSEWQARCQLPVQPYLASQPVWAFLFIDLRFDNMFGHFAFDGLVQTFSAIFPLFMRPFFICQFFCRWIFIYGGHLQSKMQNESCKW